MVAMPCDLRVSKMILLSLEIGIPETMVDIAGILMGQKTFFQHEEKRQNIESWMHHMVDYDEGYFNDFLLRQKLFAQWRHLFFMDFYKQRCPKYKAKYR